ncbi:helix-turn-helix domain-containing protein [Sulfuricurvum sp.]|uniref:helix-turn-helix domain-containing protein n=1 Tax=Sulfuricurvum sp. TaxID=2025608 RepID=UPI003C5820F5
MESKQLSQLIEVVKEYLKGEWMNPSQLKDESGLSLKTQANLRSKGKLPYYRIGNVVRYKRQEIDALFESAKVA